MPVSLTRARAPRAASRFPRTIARRTPAAIVALVLGLSGAITLAGSAAAADPAAPLVIDDFVSPAPANRVAVPNGQATFTDSASGTKVTTGTGGGSHYVTFTYNFATPIDLTQAGALTQLEVSYADAAGKDSAGNILSNPVMMGVTVTDSAGRWRSRGGTGLALGSGHFVTNFVQQGTGDVRFLEGPGSLTSVKSVALTVGSIGNYDTTSVSLLGISAVADETDYTMATFSGPSEIAVQPTGTVNATVTATGYPRPTLAMSGTKPNGVTVTQNGTSIIFGGAPTQTGTFVYTIAATTSESLTNTHTVTFHVFTKPTIAGPSAFTARVGDAFSQTLTVGGDPLPTTNKTTFTPALPTGLSGSISGSTLTISGTPTGTPGPYSGTVTVGNDFDTASGTLTIAVQGRATLPALANAVVAVNADIAPIQITGGSYPTPTVDVTGLPDGLIAKPTTGGTLITGKPTATGDSTVTVTATNGVGDPATSTFTITVASVPTISQLAPINVKVGVAMPDVPLTITGFPAPTVVVDPPGLPAGLTLSKNASGTWVIQGTPTSTAIGPRVVTLRATNALTTVTTPVAVVVSGAPTISGPTTLDLSLGATMAPVTFVGEGYPPPLMTLKDGQTLPAGLEMANPLGSFTLSGIPTEIGTTDLTIVAVNGAGTVESTVKVTVGTSPVFAEDARTITVREGQPVSEVLEAASFPAATFGVSSGKLPTGLTLAADGTLTGTPIAGSADARSGSCALTVRASNTFGSDTQALTILVRSAPKFPGGLPPATFAAGTASSYGFTVGGWDRPTVTLLDTLPTGLSLTDAGDADPTTWAITGTAPRAQMGPHTVRVALDNTFGVRTTRTLHIDVTAPFVWEQPFTSVTVETGVPIAAVEVVGTGYPIPLSFNTGVASSWLQLEYTRYTGPDSTSIGLRWTGTPTSAGLWDKAIFPTGVSGSIATVMIYVKNRPMLTAPAARTVVAGTAVDIPVIATGSVTISVSATGLPAGLRVVADSSLGKWDIVGTVDRAAVGAYDVTLTANNGLIATRNLTLTVESVPVLDDATVTTYLGNAATGVVRATGSPVPTLAVTAGDLPPGLTATDDGSGGLAFTGTPTTPGVWTATVTATNVHGDDSATVTVEVRSAPVFADTTIEQTLREGDAVDFTAAATGYPAHTVEIASGRLPAGLALSPSGRITGTPALGSADAGSGRYQLVLRAWNGEGEDTVPVTLVVLSAPSFPAGLPTASIDADTAASYTFTTGGWDHPTATLLDPLPTGLSLSKVDDTTWQITGSVARALRGPYSVRVALDNAFGRVVKTLQIRVMAPFRWEPMDTDLIVETDVPITPVDTTGTGYLMPTAYHAVSWPSWLNVKGTGWTGTSIDTFVTYRWTGTPRVAGTSILQLRPAAGAGPDITVTFHVTDRPGITAPATVTAAAGSPLTVDVRVSGTPVSKLTATGLPTGLTLVPGTTAGTWQITGTPGRDVLGEHTITLTAENGLTTTKQLTLTVTGGALLQSPTTAITTRLDAAMTPVTWTASGYPAPDVELVGDLPPGLSFVTDAAGLTLSGTPTTPGTWDVVVRTTNAYGTDERTVTITVADLPAFADDSLDLVMIEGVPTTTTLPLRGFPLPTVDVVGTIPGVTVTYVPGSAPVLSGTPEAGTAGEHTLTLTARNTIAGVEQSDVVTVNVRVDARAAITSGTDALVMTVGTAVDRTVRVGGSPEATLTAAGLPAGLTLARTAAGEWHLTGTPAVGTGGVHPVTLTATNGVLDPATATLQVTVREPVLAVRTPAAALRVGTAGTITVTTSGGWPTPPALRIEGALPRGLSFVDDGNGTGRVVGTPAAGTAGGWTVTVVADNGVGATRTALTFIVTALPASTGATTGATTGGGTTAGGGTPADPGTSEGAGAGDGSGDGSGTGTGDSAGDGSGDGSGTAAGDAATDEPPVIDVPVTVTGPGANPWWWALASLLVILAGSAAMVYRRLRGR